MADIDRILETVRAIPLSRWQIAPESEVPDLCSCSGGTGTFVATGDGGACLKLVYEVEVRYGEDGRDSWYVCQLYIDGELIFEQDDRGMCWFERRALVNICKRVARHLRPQMKTRRQCQAADGKAREQEQTDGLLKRL